MNKTFRILEIVWLVIGVIGVIMCIYSTIAGDTRSSIYFLIFTFVSGVMYSVRKRQRKKYEAAQHNQQINNKTK